MAKFKVYVSTEKVGSKCEYTLDIDDGDLEHMTDEQIDAECRDFMLEHLNWNWERK